LVPDAKQSLWFWTGAINVRPSVHGPKTDFSNAFTPCATALAFCRSLLAHFAVAFEWLRPVFLGPCTLGRTWGHPSREEGFFFALTAAPASPIHRPACNFYDPSASSDDFLANALARIRTTMETVTITENFTCASGTIIEYPLSKMR
jgi:hypothetical protein